MSDENKGAADALDTSTAAAPAESPDIKNLKAEFSRKTTNLEQSMSQLMAQLQAMQKPTQPEAPAKKPSVFEDEEAYAQRIIAEAEARTENKLRARDAELAKQQATIAALAADFPELHQGDSPLTQKAVEIYNTLSDEDKRSPIAYRAAVKEAALELGLKPKSKRTASEEEAFSLSGGNASQARKRQASESELDPRTEAFAQLMGVSLTKEVKERLSKKHGRKSYGKWE